MARESRLRGDYHEYMTVKSFCKKTGAREVNLRHGLEHGLKLGGKVRKAIEVAGAQAGKIIIEDISADYGRAEFIESRAVGDTSGYGRTDVVVDIVITFRLKDKPQEKRRRNYSLKFTESESMLFTKNPGVGSLLKDYFGAPRLQMELNKENEKCRKEFFYAILKGAGMRPQRDLFAFAGQQVAHNKEEKLPSLGSLRAQTRRLQKDKQRFETNPAARTARQVYLNRLRGKLLELLQNVPPVNIQEGCMKILGMKSGVEKVIVSSWVKGRVSTRLKEVPDLSGDFKIVAVGNDNIHIQFKGVSIGCRAKFEGGSIFSAIKFAGAEIPG